MKNYLNVFLPLRFGSERIPNKNTKNFASVIGGLTNIKLEQLLRVTSINKIFVSTNDNEVMRICRGFNNHRLQIVSREEYLASSKTSTDELIKHAAEIMPDGHILWTHVTSPFITSAYYEKFIDNYFKNLDTHDSLMTVTKLQKFIWNDQEPINYNRSIEKWPRTQTLKPVWEINSGAFIAHRAIYREKLDRIGNRPLKYELSDEIAFDIDWPLDFRIAELIYLESCRSENGKI